MHATGATSRVGVGWVPVAVGGKSRAAGASVGKKAACGAHKAVHFLASWWAHFFSAGGKRLPIDASQSASASGLESAVAAADPAGDPGLAGTATGAAAAAIPRTGSDTGSVSEGFNCCCLWADAPGEP